MKPPNLPFDIIMLALPRWDGPYSSTAYSLAQELSAYTRVFYIDNPFTFKDYITGRKRGQIQKRKKALLSGKDLFSQPIPGNANLIAVTPQLTMPVNFLPPGGLYDMLSAVNDRILFRAIRKMVNHYNIRDCVFINSFNPIYARTFPTWFTPLLNIYHCVDDISKSEYISRHGTRLETAAVRKADFTLVTSMELQRLKGRDSARVYYLPNAANVALFQQAFVQKPERPEELKQLPQGSKVILYMGNICHRIDYALLTKIAETHRDKTLVMVGPRSVDNYRKAGLHTKPNVIFTDSKPLTSLPAYVAYADCCIIPFLCNTLTRSIYPLKINEYLSAGKPVVTTDFSEDIANFGDVAFVSGDHDAFVANIQQAIDSDTPEKAQNRVNYAAGNNWEARAKQLVELIKTNLQQR